MKRRLETMKTSRVRKPRAKPQPLTNEQISALLSAADPEWRTMIFVGLNTGQRLQDVARLTWDAIDLQHATIRFRWTKAHLQTVLIGPELVAHLRSLAKPTEAQGPVFPTCFEDSMDNPAKLDARFRQMQRERGLKPVSFYCLRLTFLLGAAPASAKPFVSHMGQCYPVEDLAKLKQELSRLAQIL